MQVTRGVGHGGPDASRHFPPFALDLNTVVMSLRWTLRPLLMMMTMVLLDLKNGVWMLPAPSRVSMESVDMRHILRWRPLQASCNTSVLYSVQFQGEFELTVLNSSWVDAPECQQIHYTRCDLTFDLGSDSDYNVHVRAQCGSQLSAWTELNPPFNRRDTVLAVPKMTVSAVGGALQVSFDRLPRTVSVSVTVWKRGDELQAAVYKLHAEQTVLYVAALQEGAEYCVRAQTVLDTQLQSSSTDAHCVSITGPVAAWKKPTTVTVTVIIMAGVLFAVFWSIVHCHPDTCQTYFHKEPLPRSLRPDWDIEIQMSPEQAELCEQTPMVQSIESELQQSKTEAAITSQEGQSSELPFTVDLVESYHSQLPQEILLEHKFNILDL
ncbi:cytokine receptor family member B16 isoform X2 [Toxotes jaculatrix]|uniref:cytokine receptor family member B16 isoform X2 n=1 Tax=Toxotes jaculatrix TaxID=941984 RepID=UPI001B3AB22E|nr:cytokine receptor family member B16 isoform X2 [Toxotes jaculatrix]